MHTHTMMVCVWLGAGQQSDVRSLLYCCALLSYTYSTPHCKSSITTNTLFGSSRRLCLNRTQTTARSPSVFSLARGCSPHTNHPSIIFISPHYIHTLTKKLVGVVSPLSCPSLHTEQTYLSSSTSTSYHIIITHPFGEQP